jgi:hypothetical protein
VKESSYRSQAQLWGLVQDSFFPIDSFVVICFGVLLERCLEGDKAFSHFTFHGINPIHNFIVEIRFLANRKRCYNSSIFDLAFVIPFELVLS